VVAVGREWLLLFTGSRELPLIRGNSTLANKKVIDYLVNDWGQDFSVTSVDIAMSALKLEQSDETRFRIGSYIKGHPELHEVIRRWGWATLVLTPDEKLIARALVNAEREGKTGPGTSELAKAVGVSESQVQVRAEHACPIRDIEEGYRRQQCKLPSHATLPQMGAAAGLRLSQGQPRQRATIQHELSPRFMLLVSGKLANEKITIDDSSLRVPSRIHLVFDRGK